MKLPFSIALRYLFARKSQNVINIISMISVVGVMTGTIALLIVLSVFNGLHGLIGTLYGSFDPELRIEPVSGKVFSLDSIPFHELKNNRDIAYISQVVNDQALFKYGKRQMPGILMGVDSLFDKVSGIDSIMSEGEFKLKRNGTELGLVGFILADQMSMSINFVSPLAIYVPRRSGSINLINPESGFKTDYVMPGGIFAVKQVEYDSQYAIIGIDKARWLLDYDSTMVSYLYVRPSAKADIQSLQADIQKVVGNRFIVKSKEEQHASFFKMMKIEKLMAYLILSFILVIATFNIIGTLSLLIYEKKESIFTLKSMGANQQLVTRIFLFEGWMISLTGVIAGLVLGSILIFLQQQLGIIKFQGGDSFVVDAYPVILKFKDTVLVFVTVAAIGLAAAWYPVKVIVARYYFASKED
jgi:ABC-type lipoprotein release transport system permease subunit